MNLKLAVSRAGLFFAVLAGTLAPAGAQKMSAQDGPEPDRIRGEISDADASGIVVRTADGKAVRVAITEKTPVFVLSKGSYSELDFGTYVGSVSQKLGDNVYSPIVRDSLSWLHRGRELRIIDESLRGIAVGHTKWDFPKGSVMTHGWVDDMEGRVISIKYGPTEEEETDVEIARDTPVLKMKMGDRSMIRTKARVFVGAERDRGGAYTAAFLFIGSDGVVPGL